MFNFDTFFLIVFCLTTMCNRQGFVLCLLLAYYIFLLHYAPSNFYLFLFASAGHFLAACSNITILSEIRKVLFLEGCIFFVAALGKALYYNYGISSELRHLRPYLIAALDMYMVYVLLRGRSDGLLDRLATFTSFRLLYKN